MKYVLPFLMLACALPGSATLLLPEQENALRAYARHVEHVHWPELSPAQASSLFSMAEAYLEECRRHHMPDGMILSTEWTDRERTAVAQYHDTGDSAIWTGVYLAMTAFRHAVLQTTESRETLWAALDVVDRLTWISGRPGYVPRYCGRFDPALLSLLELVEAGSSPDGVARAPVFRGVPPYEHLVWRGSSSRDPYDGIRFGLATTCALSSDPAIKVRAGAIIERIVDRLIADKWVIMDGRGDRTRTTPGWRAAWIGVARAVNSERYEHLGPRYHVDLTLYRWFGISVRPKYSSKYYPNNLRFTRLLTLEMTGPHPRHGARFQHWMDRRYTFAAEDHLNAFLAAAYVIATRDVEHTVARATLQGMLADYPPPPRWSAHHPEGSRPELEGRREGHSDYALLTREHVPRDYIWQRSPTILYGGRDLIMTYPALDLLLPYWMGRYAGAIPGG
jgi:hypothetical protein